ncbi:MAG: prenyltransferase [Anaerolineae bacterium]|nr:prenyltransferase [Anaerolineae bacterium]
MSRAARLIAFVALGRPHFLAGGVALYSSGAAGALYLGYPLDHEAFLWGLACALAIQWMTHYSNDYFDQAADAANLTPTLWSGGSRVLQRGVLAPIVALGAALAFVLVAMVSALVLALRLRAGPLTLPLVGVSLALAWAYSAPPFRLHSRGLGELAAGVVVGLCAPLAGSYFQARLLEPLTLLSAAPLFLLAFTMILAVHFPDAAGDASVGKRTLVVRLGGAHAARLHNAVLMAAYLVLVPLAALGLPASIVVATAAPAPLAAVQLWRLRRGAWRDPRRYTGIAFRAAFILGLTAACQLAGYLLSA